MREGCSSEERRGRDEVYKQPLTIYEVCNLPCKVLGESLDRAAKEPR